METETNAEIITHDTERMYWKAPLDVRTLEKGRNYSPEDLGVSFDCSKDSQQYQFMLLRLRGHIAHDIRMHGLPMSLRIDHGCIRVMTDSEAISYHDNAAAKALTKMGREAQALATRIDASNLTEQEREKQRILSARWAMRHLAARKAQTIEQKPRPQIGGPQ